MNNEHFYQNLKKKLSNKKIVKTLGYHKRMIEELMECAIDIQFISNEDLLEMEKMDQKLKETLNNINELNNLEPDDSNAIQALSLKDIKKMLTRENENQKVFIDPIHLEQGMNPLNNLILVGMDEYVILIPKSEKLNKNKID